MDIDGRWYVDIFKRWLALGLLWMLFVCIPLVWYCARYYEYRWFPLLLMLIASLGSLISLIMIGYQRGVRARFSPAHTTGVSENNRAVKIPMQGSVKTLWEIASTRKLLRELDVSRAGRLGDTYLMFVGIKPVVVVNTAELAQIVSDRYEIFKKSDPRELSMPFFFRWVGGNNVVLANGEPWHRIRRMTHPPLNTIPAFIPIFQEKASLLCSSMENLVLASRDGERSAVFVNRWLKAVSLDSAGEALFGYNFNHLRDTKNSGIDAMNYVINEIFNPVRVAFPIVNRLPVKSNAKLVQCMGHLDRLVMEMIKYIADEKNENSSRENVLQMLMQGKESSLLSEDELRNNIIAMVLASHETTQVSMSGVLYHLAKYPEYQSKLRGQSREIVAELEKLPMATSTQKSEASILIHKKLRDFHLMGGFILESLRMYSPLANQNPRTSAQHTELNGYQIPKGSLISIAIHSIHMNPREWSRPEIFDPDRFYKEGCDNRYAFLPFGAGARICAGKNFSLVEQKIVLCYLLSKFKISLPRDDYEVPILRGSFTGLPSDSYHLNFECID
ncbi:cytochrome P450 [Burkholderia lata]|uniref:cytochrome P450 n=1 Tax=Burkholderia lata (strain ATCC 17760 / DSM 23089 / LMG 22485 / NCIMB 9086 / R18194 / 383) TaxID=482957 RepID=UPI00158269FA|nr:cytochrome P450 [Burkholderia lata]